MKNLKKCVGLLMDVCECEREQNKFEKKKKKKRLCIFRVLTNQTKVS
jgi:hypothetical protein